MTLADVFLISLSSLSVEVLLARVFSISQWNHLSFMVISIALFGFAASGTFLSLAEIRKPGWVTASLDKGLGAHLPALYAAAAAGSFALLNRIPLDYFRIPLEPVQLAYLLAAYLCLALPFFFAGLAVSMAYISRSEKTGLVYFASMGGSALGALAPLPLLPLIGEGKILLAAALLPLLSPIANFIRKGGREERDRWRPFLAGIAAAAGISALLLHPPAHEVKPSPYKALSQVLQFPDSRVTETRNGLTGRIDAVETPYIRFAPGLSLNFPGLLPPQEALFKDGDGQLVLCGTREPGSLEFARHCLSYLAYRLRPEPASVLVIQKGGGIAVPCALAAGAGRIRVIEQNPHLAAALRGHYGLEVLPENPRAFLAAGGSAYQVIHLESWGTSLPGADALSLDPLLTVEAISACLERLSPEGLFQVSRKLLLPPSDLLRLWSNAAEALKRRGIDRPASHIAVLRNWDTFTLLVSPGPIRERERIAEFAEEMNFDPVFLEGMDPMEANRFNVFEEPFHHLELQRLAEAYAGGREGAYFEAYFMDVSPQTDARPFPSRFLKWTRLGELYGAMGSRPYSLLLSGEIVVAAVFAEALAITILMLIIPVIRASGRRGRPSIRQAGFFLGLGAGFMLAELFFIKAFTVLLGDPVVSLTVVLAGMLVFSGLGGLLSQRLGEGSGVRWMKAAPAGLSALLLLSALFYGPLLERLLPLPEPARFAAAFLALLPAGILAGLPFPLGMRYVVSDAPGRAYAWSVNGCVSVLSSIAAAQLALGWGIPALTAAAAAGYAVAGFSAAGERSEP